MNLKSTILTMFAALYLAACSDSDDGVIIARMDENGYQYSPASMGGTIEFLPTMKPSAARIEVVDEQLNAVDTIELSMDSSSGSGNRFSLKSKDIEFPILRIVVEFPYGEKSKMEFSQYHRMSSESRDYDIRQNIYMALAASRIEHFVKEENFSFANAEDTVLNEMSKRFGLSASRIKSYDFPSKAEISFNNDLLLYVICRHEISDSLFYSDFKKLRDYYAQRGFVDTTMAITAADAWLSTFKNVSGEILNETVFQSVSRDTAVGLKKMQKDFFSSVYGIKFTTKDSVKIDKKSSAYYGKNFYYDNDGYSGYDVQWRLKNPIEDTLGLCLLKTKSLATYKGNEYLCENGSNVWKKNVSHNELLDGYYGLCGSSRNGDAIYVRDSLFICECDKSDSCAWNDKYAGKKVPRKDSTVFAKYVEAKAVEQFGRCYNSDYGATKKLEDIYVQCIGSRWLEVDSLTYHMGHCAKDNTKGKHLGVYYGCLNYGDYGAGDTVWAEIPWPVYALESCTAKEQKKVSKNDENYFICENSGEKKSDSSVVYKWRKLDSAEAIPPVINMDTCEIVIPYDYLKKIYDGKYYMCEDGKWHVVDNEKLSVPEKAGDICTIDLYDSVKKYDGVYYRCTMLNMWFSVDSVTSISYEYRDSLGSCDTISNGILHWNEKTSALWGCVKTGSEYQWGKVELVETNDLTLPDSLDLSRFAGGTRVSDLVYSVDLDGTVYQFHPTNQGRWYLFSVDETEE